MKEPVLEIEIVKINEEYSSWYISKINKEVFPTDVDYEFMDGEDNKYYFIKTDCTSFGTSLINGFLAYCFKLNVEAPCGIPKIIENKSVLYLQKAVYFINNKFGIEKLWRAKQNSTYFFINTFGKCDSDIECNSHYDNYRYELGNYFETREEVEKVIVSKEWKEFWDKVKNKQI